MYNSHGVWATEKNAEQVIKISVQQFERVMIEILEAKDPLTWLHSSRVAQLAISIGKQMELPVETIEKISIAAQLHDLGKVGIYDHILNKRGRLTREEAAEIQTHPHVGSRILSNIPDMAEISNLVLHHHERYDGEGYPAGLKGEDIPLESRIISLADAFEAMTSGRPYRQAMSSDDALQETDIHTGEQFCPTVASYLLQATRSIPGWFLPSHKRKYTSRIKHEELLHSKKVTSS